MREGTAGRALACAILALAAARAGSQARSAAAQAAPRDAAQYPSFGSLGQDDLIYRQHQEQLEISYEAIQNGKAPPDMIIYSYTVRSDLDLFSLAARLNLPYETIATLNRLDRSRPLLAGERVLAPSVPGVFAPTGPGSDLDLLLSYRDPEKGYVVPILVGGKGRELRFYPGARFTPEERSLFLGLLFRFPLPAGVITSSYGLRESPITGRLSKHNGIDIAAPAGTDVYAAREGVVAETGVDEALGQYLVISHDGGFSTVYGHLSARLVRLNEEVESGRIVGKVGSTGQSTGPHLHFEVRNRGESRDPEPLIPRGKR
jgi:murein DD-endopeptidase MepM/ murein hydrolase activator NlpD